MLPVTEGEAQERADLLTDIAYDIVLDLAATPARSRTRASQGTSGVPRRSLSRRG